MSASIDSAVMVVPFLSVRPMLHLFNREKQVHGGDANMTSKWPRGNAVT